MDGHIPQLYSEYQPQGNGYCSNQCMVDLAGDRTMEDWKFHRDEGSGLDYPGCIQDKYEYLG